MKIALTGGGTAGHVMPNLALLPSLKNTLTKFSTSAEAAWKKNLFATCLFLKFPR